MSSELETLDQLLGGDLSLAAVRTVYPDAEAFLRGIVGLLATGDVLLYSNEGLELPDWQWRELFRDQSILDRLPTLNLKITKQGISRIA
jgi:hypothetical protein